MTSGILADQHLRGGDGAQDGGANQPQVLERRRGEALEARHEERIARDG